MTKPPAETSVKKKERLSQNLAAIMLIIVGILIVGGLIAIIVA